MSFEDSSGTIDDAITRDGRFGLQWTKFKKKKHIYIYMERAWLVSDHKWSLGHERMHGQ